MTDIFILVIEIIGTIAFAISGTMVAVRNKLDLLGVIILAGITACGGGMLRDIILCQVPTLFYEPLYLLISLITAMIFFSILHFAKSKIVISGLFLLICDALGLGVFVVLGCQKAIELGYTEGFIIVFMGSLTGVGGGIMRDVLVSNIPFILRKHIYCLAAIIGGLVFYIFYYFNLDLNLGTVTSILIILFIRILASKFKWSLPKIENVEQ